MVKCSTSCSRPVLFPVCRYDSALPARLSPRVSALRSRSRRSSSFSARTSYQDETRDTSVIPTIKATISRKLRIRIRLIHTALSIIRRSSESMEPLRHAAVSTDENCIERTTGPWPRSCWHHVLQNRPGVFRMRTRVVGGDHHGAWWHWDRIHTFITIPSPRIADVKLILPKPAKDQKPIAF